MRVSLAWQVVLESTRRIIPLPGLMHASNTVGELAVTRASTINSTKATTLAHTSPERRTIPSLIEILPFSFYFFLFPFSFFASRFYFLFPSHLEPFVAATFGRVHRVAPRGQTFGPR